APHLVRVPLDALRARIRDHRLARARGEPCASAGDDPDAGGQRPSRHDKHPANALDDGLPGNDVDAKHACDAHAEVFDGQDPQSRRIHHDAVDGHGGNGPDGPAADQGSVCGVGRRTVRPARLGCSSRGRDGSERCPVGLVLIRV
ncbi:uncharacterized protein RHOBADRAFT_55389, partial [Rhodotorula graminis WP1]